MIFSSTLFLFYFLPITILGHLMLPFEMKNHWLLLVSFIFFGWSQPKYLWIILSSILINYIAGLMISYQKGKRYSTFWMILAIVCDLALLFYFKYFNFFIETYGQIVGRDILFKEIVLPIGISFFTFQGLSYVVDVYRGDVKAQRNILDFALYIVLFPQLIAGPIVRYKDIAKEIEYRSISIDDFSFGIERFIIGLAKKAIIANTMATVADTIWSDYGSSSCIVVWIGSIAYSLQIYFDFWGYSDMAIGLGRILGFHFLPNFDHPYVSKDISEFWRRWHISLSSWFRDYVYIPLGGNRKKVYLNLAIVFILTGIWHGAAWNFILWGTLNGVFCIVERLIRQYKKKKGYKYRSPLFLSHIYTLLVINFGWVLFRAPSITDAIKYIKIMLGIHKITTPGFTVFWYLDRWTVSIMMIAILLSSKIPNYISEQMHDKLSEKLWFFLKHSALLMLLLLSMMRIVSGTYNPFIYFQF